ncbi:unnamed protein product [Spirodela intermedia]|uniref:Uncharacterized protein n=1 Tax=Spirodela intermedia TaxID=51605 RepID=A0A7I8K2N3_SPIIN|nr:unnamed protein product [Spirodela intermedia]
MWTGGRSPTKACGPVEHLVGLLDHCRSMGELRQILARIAVVGLLRDSFLVSKVLLFSAVSDAGDVNYSYRVFRCLPSPSTFVWNTLIRGFSRGSNPNRAMSLYVEMLREGARPDNLTFPFLARACARLSSLLLGSAVHGHTAKGGLGADGYVQNSLLHMYSACGDIGAARRVFEEIPAPNMVSWNSMLDGYAKCGDMVAARAVFDRMPRRDVVSWSALIDGYVKAGEYREALTLFGAMRGDGAGPNTVTMVSVLCACAHLGALDLGRRMHGFVEAENLPLSLPLATSLVDMYAKCGAMEEALAVFRAVPANKTDVLIWNAMIGGLALHGLSRQSLELFGEMQAVGVKPDEITYLGLLSACAHGGLVEKAGSFFRSLRAPQIEHYACMVDVLGRSGRVEEALSFVEAMPMEPSASVLGALLSGCQTHGWVELGEAVGKKLIELEPEHDGRYVGLSNVYAVGRRWDEARSMRRAMEKRGVRKAPGFSSVEVDGTVHGFTAHDRGHPSSAEIHMLLCSMAKQMKAEIDHPQLDDEDDEKSSG